MLIDWAEKMFGYTVEIVKRRDPKGFQVLSKRWIVERTSAWINWSRRLSKDYELRIPQRKPWSISLRAKNHLVLGQFLRAKRSKIPGHSETHLRKPAN
jgi:transposase